MTGLWNWNALNNILLVLLWHKLLTWILDLGGLTKPFEGIVFVPIRFLMSEMADIIDVLRVYIVTAVTELLYGL